jgi:hypothetical protein
MVWHLLDPFTVLAIGCLLLIAWLKFKDQRFRAENGLYDSDDEAETYSRAGKETKVMKTGCPNSKICSRK